MITDIKNGTISVLLIDSDSKLDEIVEQLSKVKEIAFDTEFDNFNREYGFKMYLLQVFDGVNVYIFDPKKLKNISKIWKIFDDPKICKVAYACSEDIALLKLYGCHPKNIFDVQIAATLCNNSSVSFSGLIKYEYDIELDKSSQRSDWSIRPLHMSQLIYASNDVIYLLKLREKFNSALIDIKMINVLREENVYCEQHSSREFKPKLSAKQKQYFSEYYQGRLLELFNVRNEIAKICNEPPFKIVTDATLENIISDKKMLNNPFLKGFSHHVRNNTKFQSLFTKILSSIDESQEVLQGKSSVNNKIYNEGSIIFKNEREEIVSKKFNPILLLSNEKYGQIATQFIFRKVKDAFATKTYPSENLKHYQIEIVNTLMEELKIAL